jgi:hypothetical protein
MSTYVLPIHDYHVHSERPFNGIPGVASDNLKIAFLQATSPLCRDVQELIWKEVLYCTVPIEPPPAPKKCPLYYRASTLSLPKDLYKPRKLFTKEPCTQN